MAETAHLSQPFTSNPPRQSTGRTARFVRFWLRRSTWAVNLSIVSLVILVLAVIFAGQIAPFEPEAIDLMSRLQPPAFSEGGSWDHPLGTDATGRDVFSRVLYGGQVSLMIGALSTVIGLVLGTLLGLVSGYFRGWLDHIIMYLVDVQLSLPFILLAVAVALVLGNSLTVLIGLAGLATWPLYARVVRGVVLALRQREFVVAASAMGATGRYIMARHLLPNIIAPLLVLATLSIGRIILLESGLSFIGIGIKPPTPSWGNMINEGRDYLATEWWLSTMPGVALMILTLAIGTIGDWMRDLTDVSIG